MKESWKDLGKKIILWGVIIPILAGISWTTYQAIINGVSNFNIQDFNQVTMFVIAQIIFNIILAGVIIAIIITPLLKKKGDNK